MALSTDKLDSTLATLVEKLQEIGFDKAPQVIEGAVTAIQADGVLQLIWFSILLIPIALGAWLFCWGLFAEDGEDSEGAAGFGFGLSTVCLIIAMTIGSVGNPWLKASNPQASLSQLIVEKALR